MNHMRTELANRTRVTLSWRGSELIRVEGRKVMLSMVFYVLMLKLNLISCSRLDENGIMTIILKNHCS